MNSPVDYQKFQVFLADNCGILLGDNKHYLVKSRLTRLMGEAEIASLGELVDQISQFSHRGLREKVIDAMTTNETLWFRDTHPFEIFKNRLLPEFQESSSSRIRVWSAACSSGQEPFSLSMNVEELMLERPGFFRSPVEIVATELSPTMLERCRAAQYDSLSLGRGLSDERRKRFFDEVDERYWRIKPSVTSRVTFKPLNLMDGYQSLGQFDVVFCRNVLIYFSAELKADILSRIRATLRPGGYLVLGSSEGLSDVGKQFEMIQCHPGIIYKAI
ncbi:protein-glutamate O-methyltransferase CheR [bacterium]|nr:protein-glutamate O-methyltransferase CheR [bacterium]